LELKLFCRPDDPENFMPDMQPKLPIRQTEQVFLPQQDDVHLNDRLFTYTGIVFHHHQTFLQYYPYDPQQKLFAPFCIKLFSV